MIIINSNGFVLQVLLGSVQNIFKIANLRLIYAGLVTGVSRPRRYHVLVIGIVFICYSSTTGLRDSYDILKSPYDLDLFTTDDFDSEDGMDGYPAFRFQNPVTVKIDKLPLNNTTLPSPFILNTVFKLDESESSCLFQLVDKDLVKLGLCFTLAGPEVFYIDFYSESFPNKQIKYTFSGKFSTWTKMLLHVQDSRVTFYVNCAKIDSSEQSVSEIHFTEDTNLFLGHSGNGNKFFKGLIQEIKIYTNADDSKLENILFCQDVKLPASTDTGDESDFIGETESTLDCPVKGEKGDKGDYGPSLMGPQGPVGPQGPPGSPGKKGEEGTCSCTESVVSSILKNMPESKGPPGEPGPRGYTGTPGETGLTGKQGDQGERGPPGLKGERGERGDDGIPGKDGSDGTPGLKGELGPQGTPGPQGPVGPPGPACKETEGAKETSSHIEKGDQGPIGPMGPLGPQGPKGDLGAKGERGPLGERGEKGHPGSEGARGEKGERGESGQDGIPGRPGDNGIPAAKGEKGSPGEKGDRGEPGPQMRLSALFDSEIEPDELKAVEAKLKELLRPNVITQDAKSLKGEKGEPGKVGPRGAVGPMGKRGHTGAKGAKGDAGLQGPMGPPGQSAVNTLDLSRVKGDNGKDGRPGDPGPPGPPGPSGHPGLSVIGPKGEPGGIISRDTFYSFSRSPDLHMADDPGEDDDAYTAMTIVYRTTTALIKRTSTTPLGTLAYVLQEQTLVLRVENGWQYVMMGSLVDHTHPYGTATEKPYRRSVVASTPGLSHPVQRANLERAYIRLAALNKPYSGRMHTFLNPTGRNAANYDCHTESKKFGFDGNFVAFLANKVEDLRHLVKTRRDKDLPVVNIRGEKLFDSWSNMFNGSGGILAQSAANIYSFSRKNVLIDPTWPEKAVWHGGDSLGVRSPEAFCEEWQSDSHTNFGAASSLRNNMLLGQELYPCDSELIVLCVEATALRKRQRHSKSRKRNSQNQDTTWSPTKI